MGREDNSIAIEEIVSVVRRMRNIDLQPLQSEIIRELMNGERTLSEMAGTIFGVRKGDESFDANYSKVRRAIMGLETGGIVSRRGVLGREKPYHLTQFGVAKIATITPSMPRPGIVSRYDLIVYLITPILGGVSPLLSGSDWILLIPSLCSFFFLLGVAVTRSVHLIRKVS